MNNLIGSQFSIRLPHELVIKLEMEKEVCGVNSRAKMIEKCLRFYFANKDNEGNINEDIIKIRNEITAIKKKIGIPGSLQSQDILGAK